LIFSERVGTNLFGKFAGLITLILVASDLMIFSRGLTFGTDIIFSLFTLLGCFYLIKFIIGNKNNKYIFLSSTFLSLSVFFRMNGIIFFPAELLIISGFFIYQLSKTKKEQKTLILKKIWNKKNLKFLFLLFIPWLVFFSFFTSYNNYYFGDPTTTYREARIQSELSEVNKENIIFSFLRIDSERLEWVKYYSVSLIPDEIKNRIEKSAPSKIDQILGENWISLFSMVIFVGILIYSIRNKIKQTETIIIISFISVTLAFFSMSYIAPSSFSINPDIQDRYMLSNVALSSLLISFFLSSVFTKKEIVSCGSLKFNKKYIRKPIVILVIIFLIFSLSNSKPVDELITNGLEFRNPMIDASKYPIDLEGLSKESIIIDHRGRKTLEYDAMAFNYALGDRNSTFQNLKSLLKNNYEVFTFKNYYESADPIPFYRNLQSNHGIILKDYSQSFCKMILVDFSDKSENNSQADEICYKDISFIIRLKK